MAILINSINGKRLNRSAQRPSGERKYYLHRERFPAVRPFSLNINLGDSIAIRIAQFIRRESFPFPRRGA